MKKFFVLAASFLAVGTAAPAQAPFHPKTVLLNAGAYVTKESTPLTVSAEYGLLSHLGVGLRAYSEYVAGVPLITGSAFANYHFVPVYGVDPFVGMSAVRTFSSKQEGISFSNTYASLQAGARYLFTNRLGAYGQLVVPLKSNVLPGGEFGVTFNVGELAN